MIRPYAHSRPILTVAVVFSVLIAACGGQSDSRTRNVVREDGYEVPRSLLYEYEDPHDRTASRSWQGGVTTTGASTWDSTYDTGEGRSRASATARDQIAPQVPPRTHRPSGNPPPIYERVGTSAARPARTFGTTTPTVSSGASMRTGNLGRVLGGLGNMGSMMGGMVAVAGIGMALSAMGAPPFLTALFGGGGDAATAAALAAIMEQLQEINRKLDQVITKIDDLQSSVNDLSSSIQLLSGNVCASAVSSTVTQLNAIVQPMNTQHSRIFQENLMLEPERGSNTMSEERTAYFDVSMEALKALNTKSIIENIETLVVGNSDLALATSAQSGLLSQVQQCTLSNKRYLTNEDTSDWQSLMAVMITAQTQAAELATWQEVYSAFKAGRQPRLSVLNDINLTLRHSTANMGFHVSMQIPDDQILDTVTNKMWRVGPSGTTKVSLIDALKECLPDEDRFLNYAPVPSWNGLETRNLNMCVATKTEADNSTGTPLDRAVNMGSSRDLNPLEWRLPTAGEVTNHGEKFNSTVPAGTVGLIDGGVNKSGTRFTKWNEALCGAQRGVACATPSEYLSTYGRTGLLPGINIMWTNSTSISFGDDNRSSPSAMWNQFNQPWLPSNRHLATQNGFFGFCEDDESVVRFTLGLGCEDKISLFSSTKDLWIPRIPDIAGRPVGPSTARDNFCFRVTQSATPNGHNKRDWNYYYGAEVAAINLGVATSNSDPAMFAMKGTTLTDGSNPKNYRTVSPGGYQLFFANRAGKTNAVFFCDHDWFARTIVKLPQTAQSLWVRNLAPNESYYSVVSTVGPTGVQRLSELRSTLQPPSVAILSLNGQSSILSKVPRNMTGGYVVKCMVDPDVDPLTPSDVLTGGIDCPTLSFNLSDGVHRIYAVTARTSGERTISSQLEIADINLARPPTPTTTSTNQPTSSSTTAPTIAEQVGDGLILSIQSTTSSSTTTPVSVSDSTTPENVTNATTPQSASTPSTSASTGTIDVAALLRVAKFRYKSGDKVRVVVAKSSKKTCRYVLPTLTGLKRGTCKVTVTLTPQKGKKKTKSLAIAVNP